MPDNEDYAGAAAIDLTHAVTAFVTTVGAPSFPACLAHLHQQDCRFRLRVIDHVAPMHVAFQRMLDECQTPYYVQVDEDMLLYPHAVRTLYERLDATGPRVAMYVADLFDVHLQRCILGVKIFRHAVTRRYPFTGVNHFETLQVTQFTADGYEAVRATAGEAPVEGETLGLHGTQWTAQSIYERYLTLQRRRNADPSRVQWLAPYAATFLERLLRDPSENNFFALMGMVAGALAAPDAVLPAKDYRTYEALPGFEALRAFFEAVGGGAALPEPGADARTDASLSATDRSDQPGV